MNSLLARDPYQRPASAAHVAERLAAFTCGADLIDLIKQAQARVADLAGDVIEQSPAVRMNIALGDTSPAAIAPNSNMSAAVASGGNSVWGWLVATAFLSLFLFAGVVIALEMQKGQLVIESEVDNVSVRLLKDGEFYQQLKIEPGANATRLYAGKYRVEIDSGSDSLQVDGDQITLHQGQTVIARVRTVDATESADPTIFAQPEVKSEANLAAESPNLNREILDLEIELKQMLERLGQSHPSVVAAERKLKLLKEFSSRSTPPASANEPAKPEILYEGKTLTQWLDVLAHERSPATLSTAFNAIHALMVPENYDQVVEGLLRILPKLDGELSVQIRSRDVELDRAAFPLLVRALPPKAYYNMVARQCAQSQDQAWQTRLINSYRFAPKDADPTEFVDWLRLNVFESADRHPLLEQAAEIYASLLFYQPNPTAPGLEDSMLKTLEACKYLTQDFWVARDMSGWGKQPRHVETGTKFALRVSEHALSVVDDTESPPQLFLKALRALTNIQGGRQELVVQADMARIIAGLRGRLQALATNSELRYSTINMQPYTSSGRWETLRYGFPDGHFSVQFQSSYSNGNSSEDKSAVLLSMALIETIEKMQLGTALQVELGKLYFSTVPECRELYLLFKKANPYLASSWGPRQTLVVNSPKPQVDKAIGSYFSGLTTQQQWSAALIQAKLIEAFPDIVTAEQKKQQLVATKQAWTASRFIKFDSDANGKLNETEVNEFSKVFELTIDFNLADLNDDKWLNVVELFEYLEYGMPSPNSNVTGTELNIEQVEWAKRQIAKYDRNLDGLLNAEEWGKMIIKPTSADVNQDGFITAEEFASYRAKSTKGR